MSDCDYGPGAWEEVVRPVDQRRHVAQEQTAEAIRLAHDHALLQPGYGRTRSARGASRMSNP